MFSNLKSMRLVRLRWKRQGTMGWPAVLGYGPGGSHRNSRKCLKSLKSVKKANPGSNKVL